jgi:hypothetical protein
MPTSYEAQARHRAAVAAQKAQASAIDQRNFLEKQKMDALSQSRFDASLAQQKEQGRLAAEKTAYGRERDIAGDKYKGQQLNISAAHARAMEDIARAQLGQKSAEAAAKKEEGAKLPATSIEGLADLPIALEQVDQLKRKFESLKMGSTWAKAGSIATGLLGLQGTDAADFNASAILSMQSVGKILEGGKLAAGDETKYKQMLLRAGDSKSVVETKTRGMKDLLTRVVMERAQAFKQAGYRVPAMFDGEAQTVPAAPVSRRIKLPSGEIVEVE